MYLVTLNLLTGVAVQKRDVYCTKFSCCFITVQVRSREEDLAVRRIAKQAVCVARCGGPRTWCEVVGGLTLHIYCQPNMAYFPCNFIENLILNTKLLHNVVIKYCSDRFRPHFLAIFREHLRFLMFAAYTST